MAPQHFKNHSRLLVGWHGITAFLLLILLVSSILNLCHATWATHLTAALIVLIVVVLCFIFWFARVFALKAQDRAIRAEENLRYFSLTGKLLDSRLSIQQIVALRFASNDELIALATKAVEENLSSKAIKAAIINWKADYYRV